MDVELINAALLMTIRCAEKSPYQIADNVSQSIVQKISISRLLPSGLKTNKQEVYMGPLYYAPLAQPSRPLDRGRIPLRDCPTYPDSPINSFIVYCHCVIASVALDYSGIG